MQNMGMDLGDQHPFRNIVMYGLRGLTFACVSNWMGSKARSKSNDGSFKSSILMRP